MARILIIDDEEPVRFTVRQILEAEDHEVVEAANGREGVAKFHEDSPDLVIIDIIMPEQEGIETIQQLRKHSAAVPIIAISGGGRIKNLDFLDIAEKIGATSTLPKPFSREQLLNSIKTVLGSNSSV